MVEGTMAGVALLGPDLRYLFVNEALAAMNGLPADEHVGRTIHEVVPGVDVAPGVLRSVIADGVPRNAWSRGHTRAPVGVEEREWFCTYHRVDRSDGTVLGYAVVITEITEDRRAMRELEGAQRRLLLVDAAATRIGTTLEVDRTCQELADLLAETVADIVGVEVFPVRGDGDGAGALGPPPPPGVVRLRRAALATHPDLLDLAKSFGEPGQLIDYQPGSAVPRCIDGGLPVVMNDYLDDDRLEGSAPSRARADAYRANGIHSGMIVPLAARGRDLGTVTLVRVGDSPPFDEEDTATAQALTRRAAIALDNARRFTREHGIALELQRALLPDPRGTSPDLELATRYLPAGEAELVGGDWYDAIPLPGGRTLLAMGDVMGHGVAAAAAMTHYRMLLRLSAQRDLPPDELLAMMDRNAEVAAGERPATCLLAVVDAAHERCTYASAGHLPPAVVDPDGTVRLLKVLPGPPLGAGAGAGRAAVYPVAEGPCAGGGTLLMFTDGLVERRSEDIDVSLGRLASLELPPAAPLEHLLDEVAGRLVTFPLADDVALLAARVRAAGKPTTGPFNAG
ncbi:hypothetical protein BIV57_07410 [Mangrovactinospora gilvigrisea]|uniref:PAS domain-containing protein n=1 Tax=Mangrovactinospora gilvigrisea TaxID=1428644 RepID=A0A1J7C9E6_9ACTN|nr:hypothetical protein BIV57_07410 [Mangrovactinospora gilvigrisea]